MKSHFFNIVLRINRKIRFLFLCVDILLDLLERKKLDLVFMMFEKVLKAYN